MIGQEEGIQKKVQPRRVTVAAKMVSDCLLPLVDKKITEVKGPAVSGLRTGPVPWQQLGDPLGSIWATREVYLGKICFQTSSTRHEIWLWYHP